MGHAKANAIAHDDAFFYESWASRLNEESVAAKGQSDEDGDGSPDSLPAKEREDTADDEYDAEDPSQHHHLRPPSVKSDETRPEHVQKPNLVMNSSCTAGTRTFL